MSGTIVPVGCRERALNIRICPAFTVLALTKALGRGGRHNYRGSIKFLGFPDYQINAENATILLGIPAEFNK